MLPAAGFSNFSLFYAGFRVKGGAAYAEQNPAADIQLHGPKSPSGQKS
jgi:hypothetical protein